MSVAPLESPLHVCQESSHHVLKLGTVQTYATGCLLTAAKSPPAWGMYVDSTWASASVYHAGTALDYINGWVKFLEGETQLWYPALAGYIETDYPTPRNFGVLSEPKVVHGHYKAPNGSSWLESDSTSIDFAAADYWPDTVSLDAAAIAAIQENVPALTGSLSMSVYPNFDFIHAEVAAAGSIVLHHGHTLIINWSTPSVGEAVFKRHESSLVPTGVFHWDYGSELVDEITIS